VVTQGQQRVDTTPSHAQDLRHDIRWLSAGMVFEL
jgi:hypothetical protein